MTTISVPGVGIRRAALWMTGTLLSFTVMAVAIRELSGAYGPFAIVALRSIVSLVVLVPVAAWLGRRSLHTRVPRWQVVRNVLHFIGTASWTWGLGVLPLATVFTLEFTVPAWVAIFAVLFLGERLTRARGVAIAGGIIGVAVILRAGATAPQWEMLVVLGSAAAYAAAHTATKHLTRNDGTLAILFWMAVLQLPAALSLAFAFEKWPPLVIADLPGILAVGLFALSAHYCLTRALSSADAVIVIPLDFLRLPLITVVGAWLYGESLAPEVAAGAAIMIASLLYAVMRER